MRIDFKNSFLFLKIEICSLNWKLIFDINIIHYFKYYIYLYLKKKLFLQENNKDIFVKMGPKGLDFQI